jgi:sirohydrochlorin ferrochelatase
VRPARLIPLVAVAHGSKDPRAAATVTALVDAVRSRAPGVGVRAAFLDHCAPSLPQVLASLAPGSTPVQCVALPLLLTAAYHSKSDIPAQLAAAVTAHPSLDVVSADTLGPHPLLLAALERRLREAGVAVHSADERAATSVVLAAAGSSDPSANATIASLAARWRSAGGWQAVVPAYASAAGPRPDEAVRMLRDGGAARVVVATYLLAPGYFADKIRDGALGAGADVVSATLGAAPEVADVVLDRYRAAVADMASQSIVARAQLSASQGGDPLVRNSLDGGKPQWNGCTAHGRAANKPKAVGCVRSGYRPR